MSPKTPRIVICYLPALDVRRLAAGHCPYLAGLLAAYPSVRFRAQPTTDQMATLLTGTYPHQHGLWGPKLKSDAAGERVLDLLPALVTTTAQCVWHVLGHRMDLATMPPHRRRRFEWLRFNVKQIRDASRVLRPVNGLPSFFTVLGEGHGRFVYHDNFWRLDELLDSVGNDEHKLEMVDAHCLDHIQHWNMSDTGLVDACYAGIDQFAAALHRKCQRNGILFIVLSDHGMEPVERVVDLHRVITSQDVPRSEYDYFIENSKATLWFHSDRARKELLDCLSSLEFGSVLRRSEMTRYLLHFADDSYGEAYFYGNPGITFFPNDFHQFLSSAFMSLVDPQQRARLRVPWHQADHGYRSEHDSEVGFMVLAEECHRAWDDRAELIDIAPSVLQLVDRTPPATMKGRNLFQPRRIRRALETARA
jgi:Type I phosphodiesterase / nucleotide pyrophosphatase